MQERAETLKVLLQAMAWHPVEAEGQVPPEPGLYLIHLMASSSLPGPFQEIQVSRHHPIIYTGKAGNLRRRLIDQDLRHRQPSTFFRGVGAMLGYRPAAGSLVGKQNINNYAFSTEHSLEIIKWMNSNLLVSWLALASPNINQLEQYVIANLRPLLNTRHNPDAIQVLAELREECRRIARTMP